MDGTVRIYQPIYAEIPVMDVLSVIPAITVNCPPLRCLPLCNRLITPLPYKTAAYQIAFVYPAKIVFQIPRPISHRMAIFAENQWF